MNSVVDRKYLLAIFGVICGSHQSGNNCSRRIVQCVPFADVMVKDSYSEK